MKKLEKVKTWMKGRKKLIGGVVIGAGAIAGGVIFGKTFNVNFERKASRCRKEATGWGLGGNASTGKGVDFILCNDHKFGAFTVEGKALSKHFDKEEAERLVDRINYYLGKGQTKPDMDEFDF